jgi:phage tail sheath protein FI
LAELVFSRAETARQMRPQASIQRAVTAVTAFIGRTLKGPVNQPVVIGNFNDYQRVFGGLWQHSMLSYALEQYFQNGGRDAIVVRVCNGGHAPTLRLPAGAVSLTLVGLWPSARDFLRASVDYDGIDAAETDRFNLVIQRIRAPGSEFIEDQEIFRRVSIHSAAERGVAGVLAGSRLVRARGAIPRQRPDLTRGTAADTAVGYVMSNNDGDDGDELSNYDIIGDAKRGTGLFALQGAGPFSYLCVPPLTRELDVGLPALLVALRMCRQRQALLLVDPPAGWSDAAAALEGLRNWPLQSENAVMFFPRVVAFDRLRSRHEVFAPAGAAAGLLARLDRSGLVWGQAEHEEEPLLRPALRGVTGATDLDHLRLSQAGVNLLTPARVAAAVRTLPLPRFTLRTLLPEAGARSDCRELALRRLALFIMSSIEHGTRWAVYEQSGPALWARVRAQIVEFMQQLERAGAFAGRSARENYFVICDQRLNDAEHVAAGQFRLLFGFASFRPADFQGCLVTHHAGSSSVRPVSVNRYALPPRS